MNVRSHNSARRAGLGAHRGFIAIAAISACCVGLLALAAIVSTPSRAAAIPAWLDDGISKWNAENPAIPIRFVNIKDSFVWYDMPMTAEIGHQRIREGMNKIALANGYVPLDDEELVTTAKPPVPSGPSAPKKCWSRSFVLNIKAQENTKAIGDVTSAQRQRMLTRLVCEDDANWWAAFRVAD